MTHNVLGIWQSKALIIAFFHYILEELVKRTWCNKSLAELGPFDSKLSVLSCQALFGVCLRILQAGNKK